MTYEIYKPGNKEVEILKTEKPLELHELQHLIGGYIEYFSLGENVYAVINEDGRMLNLPDNGFIPYIKGVAVVGIMDSTTDFAGFSEERQKGITQFSNLI